MKTFLLIYLFIHLFIFLFIHILIYFFKEQINLKCSPFSSVLLNKSFSQLIYSI